MSKVAINNPDLIVGVCLIIAVVVVMGASLVAAVTYAAEATGLGKPQLKAGSTDSNAAASAGIPSMTIDGGGSAGNLHSLKEWFEPAGSSKGIQKLLLTVLRWDETSR